MWAKTLSKLRNFLNFVDLVLLMARGIRKLVDVSKR